MSKLDTKLMQRDMLTNKKFPLRKGGNQTMRVSPECIDNAVQRYGYGVKSAAAFERGGFWDDMKKRHPHIMAGSDKSDVQSRGMDPVAFFEFHFGKPRPVQPGRYKFENGKMIKVA